MKTIAIKAVLINVGVAASGQKLVEESDARSFNEGKITW